MSFKTYVLIAVVLFQVYDFIKNYKNDFKKKFYGKLILFIRIFVICLIGYYAISDFSDAKKEKKVIATIGEFGKQKDASNNSPVLQIGFKGQGNGRMFAFSNNPIDPINIKAVDGQIFLTAYLRDSKGDTYASISDRTWEIQNTNNIDYNNDDSAFEIITGGRVVFQVILKKDTAIVNGMLCSESGDCVFCYKESFSGYGRMPGTQRFIIPPNIDIKPVFKYPRSKYLGIREDFKD